MTFFAGAAVMAMSGSVTSVRIETSAFLGPGAPAVIHRSMVRISFAEGWGSFFGGIAGFEPRMTSSSRLLTSPGLSMTPLSPPLRSSA